MEIRTTLVNNGYAKLVSPQIFWTDHSVKQIALQNENKFIKNIGN